MADTTSDTTHDTHAERAEFFATIQIPFNDEWRENGLEFVNSVQVAEIFIKATSYASALAEQAEALAEKLSNLDYILAKRERALMAHRRQIFARNFSEVTKSAAPEIQNAFLLAKATEEEQETLLALEAQVAEVEDARGRLKPHLDKVRARMKLLERNMDWAREFVNYDKLLQRIENGGRT